jgi:hypothetical protein
LEIKQCLFAGDEVTNPNHLGILANGSGIVVDHCIFYHLKQPIVYWTGGSKGHAMRNTLVHGAYGCGIWTSGIANDFEFRNNVIANSFTPGYPRGPGPLAPRSDKRRVAPGATRGNRFTTR